ncbi:hypothetical protein ACIQXF_20130 [Lysinibacillus sp. NPDC097231]|uniref:hypothetical protein n=1 Tax=Lysinibacillus sp. NPDC097231 TaxID=3364142 RepID=UPI003814BBB2
MQLWFQNQVKAQLCGVLQGSTLRAKKGIVFLPGLGQTKAGPYFLFTQIARKFENHLPTFQFDYMGTGDSEGDLENCSFGSFIKDSIFATNYFIEQTKIEKVTFVCSGIGNYLASILINYFPNSELILLAPNYKKYNIKDFKIIRDSLINTASLSDWSKENYLIHDFFQRMGSGLNRNKGIYLQRTFIEELIDFNIKKQMNMNIEDLLEFSTKESEGNLTEINGCELVELRKSNYNSFHPLEVEKIIENIFEWVIDKNTGKSI